MTELPLDQLEVSLLAFIRHRAFELAQHPSFDRLDAQLKQLLLKGWKQTDLLMIFLFI